MELVEYEGLVEYERWIEKCEVYTWVCTCSCLWSNTHRILTVDVFHLGLKLHWKHYTSINFHCLQARLLWRWWSFGNCVLPLSFRREFFQMEKGNGEDARVRQDLKEFIQSEVLITRQRSDLIIAPQHRPCVQIWGTEKETHKHSPPSRPPVQPSQPGGNSLHMSLWSLC